MAKGISLFGRKRTSELNDDIATSNVKKDELLALKLQQINEDAHQTGSLLQIPLSMLKADQNQPRKTFRNIESLADSIKENGIIQPIIIRAKDKLGQYIIIAGERRYQAAKLAGLKAVPCIIRQENDASTLILQLLENDQREDVSPLEESEALVKLITDLKVNKAQVAKELGRDAAWVSMRVGLQHASPEIKSLIKNGRIEDVRTLHELRMLEKESPEKSQKLIQKIQKNQVAGSYRTVISNMRKAPTIANKAPISHKTRKILNMEKKGNQLILDIGTKEPLKFKLTPDVMVRFLANITYD